MMALLRGFDLAVYRPRCYVVAATDAMSAQKAAAFEVEAAAAALAAAEAGADEEAPASAKKGRKPSSPSRTPQRQPLAAVRRSPRVAAAAASKQAAAGGRRALPGLRSPESPNKWRLREHPLQQQYSIAVIPRSREVGQSFASSVPSTLKAVRAAGGPRMGAWQAAGVHSLAAAS